MFAFSPAGLSFSDVSLLPFFVFLKIGELLHSSDSTNSLENQNDAARAGGSTRKRINHSLLRKFISFRHGR